MQMSLLHRMERLHFQKFFRKVDFLIHVLYFGYKTDSKEDNDSDWADCITEEGSNNDNNDNKLHYKTDFMDIFSLHNFPRNISLKIKVRVNNDGRLQTRTGTCVILSTLSHNNANDIKFQEFLLLRHSFNHYLYSRLTLKRAKIFQKNG